jgi:hypothetical protein
MFFTVYKITNQIDGKIYIGSHKTKDLNDNYMGSGKYLKRAIEKYGIENFTKDILFVYDKPEPMFAKEAELVNRDFLTLENTYNLKIGGTGGFDYLNNWKNNPTHSSEHMSMMIKSRNRKMSEDEQYDRKIKNKISEGLKLKFMTDREYKKNVEDRLSKIWIGRKHSQKTKEQMRVSALGKQDGEKNSQYGSMWITNEIENIKIKKTDNIPKGWRKGRVMK